MNRAATSPLIDKADIVRGVTFSKGDAVAKPLEGYTPVLRAGNIQSHLILDRDLVYIPEKMVSEKQRLRRGDIVMCTSSGSAEIVGKTAFADQNWPGSFGAFCAVVRPKPGKCDARYLFHYLQTPEFRDWTRNSSGVGIKNIRKSELDSYEIPFPSLDAQRRIAAILDKADAICRKREQALALADDFLRSVFLNMFGDPLDNPYKFSREHIGDHLSKSRQGIQSGPFGAALKKHEYLDRGVPVWGVENVHPNRFMENARLFISNEKYELLTRYNVVPGDVLISRAGTVGRMCVAEPSCAHSIISTNLIRVSLDPAKLLPEYFVCLFTYFSGRLGALRANNKDHAFTFLNPKTLRKVKIPIPEIERQKSFVQMSRKLEELMVKAQNQHSGLSELFLSLSQRAFRGEL